MLNDVVNDGQYRLIGRHDEKRTANHSSWDCQTIDLRFIFKEIYLQEPKQSGSHAQCTEVFIFKIYHGQAPGSKNRHDYVTTRKCNHMCRVPPKLPVLPILKWQLFCLMVGVTCLSTASMSSPRIAAQNEGLMFL